MTCGPPPSARSACVAAPSGGEAFPGSTAVMTHTSAERINKLQCLLNYYRYVSFYYHAPYTKCFNLLLDKKFIFLLLLIISLKLQFCMAGSNQASSVMFSMSGRAWNLHWQSDLSFCPAAAS